LGNFFAVEIYVFLRQSLRTFYQFTVQKLLLKIVDRTILYTQLIIFCLHTVF